MFKLNEDYLTITPKLRAHWEKAVNDNAVDGLRAYFLRGGCSGQELKFDVVNKGQNTQNSYIMINNDLKLYLDQKDMHVFAGGTLDLTTEGINQVVKLTGPNLNGACGCGQSYDLGNN